MSFEGSKAVLIKDLSGNILSVAGGSISANAQISGQPITFTNASGFNAVYLTNQAGTSGVLVAQTGDNVTNGTMIGLFAHSTLNAWDETANRFNRVRTTVSGSIASQVGTQFRLLTDTTEGGTTFRTRISGYLPVTDASGGASVGSGVCAYGVNLRNISGSVNGIIWVGGSGIGLAPFSGHGRPLLTDDETTIRVNNFLQLRAVANISGVLLAATGVDF